MEVDDDNIEPCADLSDEDLSDEDLSESDEDLFLANLISGRLTDEDLSESDEDLFLANLISEHLTGANLSGKYLIRANPDFVDLSDEDPSEVVLSKEDLILAFLDAADQGAFLDDADLDDDRIED